MRFSKFWKNWKNLENRKLFSKKTLDKPNQKCYTMYVIKRNEVIKMFYIKSISGQVYEVEEMPKFSAGYEMVGKAEYEEWLKKTFG